MIALGYLASALVGVSLGIMGAGGSILMVPILTYLFGIPAVLATTYSLFVVGVTAAVGASGYVRSRSIDFPSAVAFGIPSSFGVLASRSLLVPAIPRTISLTRGISVSRDQTILVLFAILMIAAATSMIRRREDDTTSALTAPEGLANLSVFGAMVGLLMGLVGAGGGFLIIPALVVKARLPMREAVGTSLLIIAANSLIGFGGAALRQPIEWPLVLSATILAVGGTVAGGRLAKGISAAKLKPSFGVFILIVGAFIVTREILR